MTLEKYPFLAYSFQSKALLAAVYSFDLWQEFQIKVSEDLDWATICIQCNTEPMLSMCSVIHKSTVGASICHVRHRVCISQEAMLGPKSPDFSKPIATGT